jgi:hypothetical protein
MIDLFRYELDGTDQTEKYPPSFRLTLDTTSSKRISSNEQEIISKQFDNTLKKPQCLFKEEAEFRQTIEEYGKNRFHSFFFLENKLNLFRK